MQTTKTLGKPVHKSRFGYYACDKETLLKLKEINKFYLDALHRKASWERWNRKKPNNRVIRQKIRDEKGNVVGYDLKPYPEPKLNYLLKKQVDSRTGQESVFFIYQIILINEDFIRHSDLIAQEYKYARRPQKSPDEIRDLRFTKEMLDKLSPPK